MRDYIHVRDLAEAHILAARRLSDGGSSDAFNSARQRVTVLEVIDAASEAAVSPFCVRYRTGGPATLLARRVIEKSPRVLGWHRMRRFATYFIRPRMARKHPDGYGDTMHELIERVKTSWRNRFVVNRYRRSRARTGEPHRRTHRTYSGGYVLPAASTARS